MAIQILGTNGKGSTAFFLSQILQAHPLRVGLFTSPHLVSVCERVQINGQKISQEDFAHCYYQLLPLFEKHQLSYFEKVTLLASLFFQNNNCDVVLWETGLGGKNDAVTALKIPYLVFTPIGLDHQDRLGSTLGEIARHKAEVMAQGEWIYSAKQVPEVTDVFQEVAQSHHKQIHYFQENIVAAITAQGTEFSFQNHLWKLAMYGSHYAENAALAIKVAQAYLGEKFCLESADEVLRTSVWPARLEWRSWQEKKVLFSCAHNLPSLQKDLASIALLPEYSCPEHWLVVTAVSGNRPLLSMFSMIQDFFPEVIVTRLAEDKQPVPPSVEQYHASQQQALLKFHQHSQYKYLLVIGSIYLCGQIIEQLPKKRIFYLQKE